MATTKINTDPSPAERLAALRAELARRGLTGFVVPLVDPHQSEFPPAHFRRLEWLTGFRGSAGMAIVNADEAAIFVDGRYTLQVRDEVDTGLFSPHHITDDPPATWIEAHCGTGDRLGYDPWLHTPDGLARLEAACKRAGAALVAADPNPVDAVWTDQPPPPAAPAVPHAIEHAGQAAADKREEVARAVAKAGADAVVLSAPDSIAWLFNIRGGDVPCTPVVLCYALLQADRQATLFLDPAKRSNALSAHLGGSVALDEPDALGPALDALGEAGRRVLVDPATAASWLFNRLEAAGATVVRGEDPCALPKACKNDTEIEGARAAHRRDGAALVRFLAWLARTAPSGELDEIAASDRLEAIRTEGNLFRGLSFPTISGTGPNGAIVHYHARQGSARRITPGDIYLVDSGAQYLDGTTDVTRTVHIAGGEPPSGEMRDRFTRVLKGHIALATARFPAGTAGSQLDALARTALWQVGLDYDHGTGHGVGAYLGVHEGPQRISKLPSRVALRPGMIVSNEPGYYKTGAYGIRIENLVTVCAADQAGGPAEREILEFETLTLAPIDRALIEPALLDQEERTWLNAYHGRVRETLTPMVDSETAAWLAEATRPI